DEAPAADAKAATLDFQEDAPPKKPATKPQAPRKTLGDGPKWSDDPIRLYLAQMAEIPLLTREQEIGLAKKIEITRKRFRRTLLGCHFALDHTVETLKKVHQ